MACFTATIVEAIAVSVIKKNVEKKEAAAEPVLAEGRHSKSLIPLSRKLSWLSKMLWGGSFLLAIEHIWHGEIVPWPPFLTALSNPADIQPMLMEILTVGGGMVLLVTAAWLGIVLGTERLAKKAALSATQEG